MKKEYRNTVKILYDVLTVCTEECSISKLSRKSNLSHACLIPVIDRFVKLGYLTKTNTGRTSRFGIIYLYRITDKGYRFAASIEEFANDP